MVPDLIFPLYSAFVSLKYAPRFFRIPSRMFNIYMYVRHLFIVLSRHIGGYSVKEIEEIIINDHKAECDNMFLTHVII